MRRSIMLTMAILLNAALITIPCLAEVEEPSKSFGRPFQELWNAVLDLQSQINDLSGANETLLARVEQLEAQNETLRSDLSDANDAISSLESQLSAALNDISANASAIGSNTTAINDLQTDVEVQQQLTSYMGVNTDRNEVYFTGANVYVQSGSGSTSGTPNGLGNLIIGYNELRPGGNIRSGSHNLIVGSENNFSSFGGLVVGDNSETSAMYAVTFDSDSDINISGINLNLVSTFEMELSSGAIMDIDSGAGMNIGAGATLELQGVLITLN